MICTTVSGIQQTNISCRVPWRPLHLLIPCKALEYCVFSLWSWTGLHCWVRAGVLFMQFSRECFRPNSHVAYGWPTKSSGICLVSVLGSYKVLPTGITLSLRLALVLQVKMGNWTSEQNISSDDPGILCFWKGVPFPKLGNPVSVGFTNSTFCHQVSFMTSINMA